MTYSAACELITTMMNWTDDSKYYVVPGQKFADEKAIVFNLNDAESFAIRTLKGGDENKSDDEEFATAYLGCCRGESRFSPWLFFIYGILGENLLV